MSHRFVAVAAAVLTLAAAGCLPPTKPDPLPGNCVKTGTTVRCTFAYNGKDGSDGEPQQFAIPPGVHLVTIDAYGAQGGGDGGGLGGHARGTFSVTDGTVLRIRVGGMPTTNAGGYNGGGNGGSIGNAGGGASDVRVGTGTLSDRIVIGGGGGGGGLLSAQGFPDVTLAGGAGGGASGGDGQCTVTNAPVTDGTCGTGGASTKGGSGGTSTCHNLQQTALTASTAGAFGVGGTGATLTCTLLPEHASQTMAGAGGGGGWYGGGGGGAAATVDPVVATVNGAGGGGSGLVFPTATSPLDEAGVQHANGSVFISYTPASLAGPTIAVSPTTGLHNNQTVTMTGSDWASALAGAFICQTSVYNAAPPSGDARWQYILGNCGGLQIANVASDGTFTLPYLLQQGACGVSAGDCVLYAMGENHSGVFSTNAVPISFATPPSSNVSATQPAATAGADGLLRAAYLR